MRLSLPAILLFLCAMRASALGVVVAPAEPTLSDIAKVTFTALHTKGRNWLQLQVAPVGACQHVVVDSVQVSDSSGSLLGGAVIFLGNIPRRDVRVRWRLVQDDIEPAQQQSSACAGVTASRHLIELPSPQKSPGSDTLLLNWVPRFVAARGGGRDDTVEVDVVDQTNEMHGISCPLYYVVCPGGGAAIDSTYDPVRSFRDSLKAWNARGLTLFHIRGTGDSIRVPIHPDSLSSMDRLGPTGLWGAGNRAWIEEVPARVVKAWGPSHRTEWRKRTGRVFHRWSNNAGPCCENCDTLCDRGSLEQGVSSSGVDVELSNDSTRYCGVSAHVKRDVTTLLRSDWLVLPDSGELATGLLGETLDAFCFTRVRAWSVVDDSVVVGGRRIALAELDGLVGVAPRNDGSPRLRVEPTVGGIVIRTGLDAGTGWRARVRDIHGRILTESSHSGAEAFVGLQGRGLLVVDVVVAGSARRATTIR